MSLKVVVIVTIIKGTKDVTLRHENLCRYS